MRKILELVGAVSVIIVVWLVLFALLDFVALPIITLHEKELRIPDLLEMPFPEASRIADSEGFNIQKVDSRADAKHPEGVVIEQHPLQGTLSKVGRKIKVVVSAGKEQVIVPNMVGKPEKEAKMNLEALGFVVPQEQIRYIFNNYYPEGVVAVQSASPNSKLQKGASIILTVSLGDIPKRVVVPDLYSLRLKDAIKTIMKTGLILGKVEKVFTAQLDSGLVVAQAPIPGTKVRYQHPIDLKVSEGKNTAEENDGN
jgi:beta-lactam-binding protein with PASTA domain